MSINTRTQENERDVNEYVSTRSQCTRFNESNFVELEIRLLRADQELKRLKGSLRRIILSIEDEGLVNDCLYALLGLLNGDRYATYGLPSLLNHVVNLVFSYIKLTANDLIIYDLFVHKNATSKDCIRDPQGYLTIEQIDEAIREVKSKADGGENANS